MADTPFPTNRTMRRAAENAAQPSAPDRPERELQLRNARRATHITRSFTPPEPSAYADKPASPQAAAQKAPLIGELAAQRPEGAVPAPRHLPGGGKKTTPPPSSAPPLEGEAPPAAATGRTSPPLHRAGQAPSRAAPSHTKRRVKGKDDAPATPADVIRRRRRRCADAQDIADFLGRLAAMAVLLVILFGLAFGITPMADDDMAPRISAGDLLLYYRLANDWSNGDVMVFEKDGEQYVGRIVARGGDTVEVTDQATLVVNGSTVLENDIYYTTPPYDDGPAYPLTLAADEFFVLCDYREGARDSRWFGPVKQSEIKGKVITVVRRSGL